MGFAAGAVVAVVGADVLGCDASANEAPKAVMERTLKAVPPKIRARPTVGILTVLPFSTLPWDAQTCITGCTGGNLAWIAPRERMQNGGVSARLGGALSVMSGGPGKARQADQDHYCPHDRPLTLAAHSRTLNDFGSLEDEYRADRTEHDPDARSYPHSWLRSPHKDRDDPVVSVADGSTRRISHL
jgi:hypothetical protein